MNLVLVFKDLNIPNVIIPEVQEYGVWSDSNSLYFKKDEYNTFLPMDGVLYFGPNIDLTIKGEIL